MRQWHRVKVGGGRACDGLGERGGIESGRAAVEKLERLAGWKFGQWVAPASGGGGEEHTTPASDERSLQKSARTTSASAQND